MVLIPIREDI